jgi:hypothetical protein
MKTYSISLIVGTISINREIIADSIESAMQKFSDIYPATMETANRLCLNAVLVGKRIA